MATFKLMLDSIYEALDNEKYDVALQLCLKPEIQMFNLGKALLSYTYAIKRNNKKAYDIAKLLMDSNPLDEPVINTVGCTLKMLNCDKEFAELYENALKKKSFEESYVVDLFNCYCRLLDPKNMQFIAQKLYKLCPTKMSYLLWSVTCMHLQTNLPTTMLQLAEKMTYKLLYDLKAQYQPSAEELTLYTYTLVRQG